jgi:hypothetical protein
VRTELSATALVSATSLWNAPESMSTPREGAAWVSRGCCAGVARVLRGCRAGAAWVLARVFVGTQRGILNILYGY